MRHLYIIATVFVLLLSLSAGMCSKDNPDNLADYIKKVQETAVQVCGFEPTASTVANIVGAGTGNASATIAVTTLAHGICDAIVKGTSETNALMSSTATYDGVIIKGEVKDEKKLEEYKPSE